MFPTGTPDPEYPAIATESGVRKDGRDLVQEWTAKHQVMGAPGRSGKSGDKGRAAGRRIVA